MEQEKYKAKSNNLQDENNNEMAPNISQKDMEQAHDVQSNAKALKVAAKGVANAYTGGAAGKVVDMAANTQLGQNLLNTGGKVVSKVTHSAPIIGKTLQNTINKANDSGALDVADQAMDMASPAGAAEGAAGNAASKAASGASNLSKASDVASDAESSLPSSSSPLSNLNPLNNLFGGNNSKDGNGSDLLGTQAKKIFLKPQFLIPIAGIALFFLFFMALIGISPNAGAVLDLTSSSSSNSSMTNVNLQYSTEQIENLLVYVGDSRTIGMQTALNNDKISYVAETGQGYTWFSTTGITQLKSILDGGTKKFVVFAFGINDLGNIDSYINIYNSLISEYPNVKFYFMSVNPINETLASSNGYTVTTASIGTFNQKLSSTYGESYIDTYSSIADNFTSTDGIHYDNATYVNIHNAVISYLKSKNTLSNIVSLDYYPTSSESKELIGESLVSVIGEDGITELNAYINSYITNAGTCTGAGVASAAIGLIYGLYQYGYHLPYYYGGGHGVNNGVDPNWGANIGASTVKPDGVSYDYYSGLDCSGFVSWCMNTAGVSGVYTNTYFKDFGDVIDFSAASSGDVLVNDSHIVLILENKGDYLQTAESSDSVKFSKYTQSDVSSGGYEIIDMDDYYTSNCTK